jgi:hypothetical protein
MKKVAVLLGLLVGFCAASTAMATPFTANVANDVYGVAQGGAVNGIPTANDSNDGIPDQFNAVNRVLGTAYTHNYQLDSRFVEPDYVWQSLASPAPIVLIGLTAGNSNTLGFYTGIGTGSGQQTLLGPFSGFGFTGDGTSGNPFPGVLAGGLPSLHPFGWFLDSNGTKYYSESALNTGGWDHLMSFYLPELEGKSFFITGVGEVRFTRDSYLLAWEDLPYAGGKLGDEDYDDMLYIVARVSPVPEPTTLLLLGLGLIGMAGVRRFRK